MAIGAVRAGDLERGRRFRRDSGVLLLLTLLFGRVYCSFICPLGILRILFSESAAGWRRSVS
ncbi:MAG: 4Fe-4S binding protein [Akkermansia sp.]